MLLVSLMLVKEQFGIWTNIKNYTHTMKQIKNKPGVKRLLGLFKMVFLTYKVILEVILYLTKLKKQKR
jgi:hypothetical protein